VSIGGKTPVHEEAHLKFLIQKEKGQRTLTLSLWIT